MLRTCIDAGLLFCPTCRGMEAGQYREHPLVLAEVLHEEEGAIRHGFLGCAGCPARFPVVDGIPILMKDMTGYMQRVQSVLFERDDLPSELGDWVLSQMGDEQTRSWLQQMLAIYGLTLSPIETPPDSNPLAQALDDARRETRAFVGDRLDALVGDGSPLALDAGCGVGASSLDLAGRGARVLALDHELGALRVLSRLRRTGAVELPGWRHGGSDYVSRRVERPDAKGAQVLPISADALNPPLKGDSLDLAVCFNTLDNVEQPLVLIRQLHALVKPGGTIVFASPYDFVSRCTPPEHRLGDGIRVAEDRSPAQAMRDLLGGRLAHLAPELKLEVTYERDDLPWILPRHGRSTHLFFCHYVEARVRPE